MRRSLQLLSRFALPFSAAFPLLLVLCAPARAGDSTCIAIAEAGKHIGSHRCVQGRVVRVEAGKAGVHYLDFCEDYRSCPFTVVVFASDLKQVGDVRALAGKNIKIRGDVQEYDGRAEIILERASQLQGEGARLPPVPKAYDVEQRGHYSAGSMKRPKKTTTHQKKAPPPPKVVWETAGGEPE